LGGYGSNFILSALGGSSSSENLAEDSRKELRDYLESPRDINIKDPIKWWGVGVLFHGCFITDQISLFSITLNNFQLCLELLVIIWLSKARLLHQNGPFQVLA